MTTTDINDEWLQFLSGKDIETITTIKDTVGDTDTPMRECPECDPLFISTTTKVVFLNQPIDIHRIFWELPITPYWEPREGIIKKQIKVVSKTPEECEEYKRKLAGIPYYVETILKQINNPGTRRIQFKDERKITVGMSKKDIINCRSKVKNAFYNCFAMIVRFPFEGVFREIHVKVFNTGKLEIPGILNPELLVIVKQMILRYIQPYVATALSFVELNREENILINSNFNCGFYINREKLHKILKTPKYAIETAYEPCSYPGVKCKFYFNTEIGFDVERQLGQVRTEDRAMKLSELNDDQKYTEISFMIFRTGSIIIVGNCSERVLVFVYEFIKRLLRAEYANICVSNETPTTKNKMVKIRKKMIFMTNATATASAPEHDAFKS
jgi:hypothetical protein